MNHTTDTNSSLSFRPFETMRIISRMQPLDYLPDWNEFGSIGKNSISGVFANKGEVLGYVQHVELKSANISIWYTLSLEVQEEFRGQGIATALITASMSDTIELTKQLQTRPQPQPQPQPAQSTGIIQSFRNAARSVLSRLFGR